ncbi:long-chain-alcohol O-fatty-acyltransferase-like [Primulina huaijiensis]|uniref:long-chain-alcohol O-fatty-acyltransferase-like n=1 Tax=Primulina huaijiensis TaxID=1492673 RepID=UPI003CC74C13
MTMNFDSEIHSFIKVWLTATTSLIFCHQIPARIPGGAARLLSILPIIYLFTILPTHLSSIHLATPTIFYLVWLGNFKLLLFSFDQGPLSANPPLSLLHFISIALLPIKTETSTKQNPSPTSYSNLEKWKKAAIFAVKCLLLAANVCIYKFRDFFHQYAILALYCFHLYLSVEIVLAITAAPVRPILGLELEPQFNEPYLATSLQDFWGRRWNLMVPGIMRPTVYHPVRRISARVLGNRWALPPAILATFIVSGLMHEAMYYYLSRASPTWEVTWFFVLQGFCLVVEVAAKKAALAGGWRLHRMVSGPLTVVFVAVTGRWLFFPQVIRNGLDRRTFDEYHILFGLIGEWGQRLISTLKF